MSATNWCPFRHVRFNEKQNVSHVPKMTQQLKANSVYRRKALFPNTFPSIYILLYYYQSLFLASSSRFLVPFPTSLSSIPLSIFSPPRSILMMAGLSQFSHHLRLICDTQLCQLKPLMAQRSTRSCQNCQPRNIPVRHIRRLVRGQGSGCRKIKRR